MNFIVYVHKRQCLPIRNTLCARTQLDNKNQISASENYRQNRALLDVYTLISWYDFYALLHRAEIVLYEYLC